MKYISRLLQFEQQLLALLLLLLHILIWHIENPQLKFALTSVLYGLFILWQPIWSKDSTINQSLALVPVLCFLLFSYFYPNESLILFILVLCGLIGSRIFGLSATRSFDLLALSVLILEVSIGIIPPSFEQILLPINFSSYMQVAILIPIITFLFASNPDRSQQTHSQIDLTHGVLASSLIFIVLLGGITINILYGVDYLDGLLLTVFIVATLTLGISWFWNPDIGHSGLGTLWNRYTMTIGGPFESWINTLTTLIEEPYLTPQDFLATACENLLENEWLNGIYWKFPNHTVSAGSTEGTAFTHSLKSDIYATLYFKSNPGTALQQHTVLLIRMAYQFYIAKMNQEKIRAEEHFETIHHTGARLTHDIKNILQSIKASVDIVNIQPEQSSSGPFKLLKRNLDQISHRLESTLNKLRAPELSTRIKLVTFEEWFKSFQNEHSNPKINFHTDIQQNYDIPPELFDSVINNLLANALIKTETSEVIIDLSSTEELIIVTVCDNGAMIDNKLESQLLTKPVSSGQGMGIGLYQSAILARTFNYELDLANNEEGRVCFSLFQHLRD